MFNIVKEQNPYDEQVNRVLAALSNGTCSPIMPSGWKPKFLAILQYTDLSPVQAAKVLKIPYSAILHYIKTSKDSRFQKAIDTSIEAHYTSKLLDPSDEDRRGHQLIQLGIKAFTSLLDKEDGTTPLSLDELENIKAARLQFILDLRSDDIVKDQEIQQNVAKHTKIELAKDSEGDT
tara:strand:+ start:290 stop:820 length:531 start_codon:yes stop_codon:yes gene_type:complete